MHLDLKHPVELVVVEVHPASNGNVWKLEERFVVVRRWDLQEKKKVWIDRMLQWSQQANPRTWALLVCMWWL